MITLCTLGVPDLRSPDGRSLQSVLSQPKRLALLVYLTAAHPRGLHRRDTLTALLWPELDEQHARNSLSQALSYLRRSLGAEVLITRGTEEVGVDPRSLRCDAVLLEECLERGVPSEALELYRGDFLTGFHVSDAPEFEHWVDGVRARLRTRAAGGAWSLAEAAGEERDPEQALQWGRRALLLSQDDEVSLRRWISLLDRQGDCLGAIRAYAAFAERLAAEHQASPSTETQALIASIRQRSGSPPAIPPADPVRYGSTSAAAAPPEPIPSPGAGQRYSRRWRTLAALGAGGAATLVLGVSLALRPQSAAGLSDARVLVAPLEKLEGGSPRVDPLGRWAADWITQGLQETGAIEVVDPVTGFVSAEHIDADSTDLTAFPRARALAREVGAGTVVWGSFREHRDSLYFDVIISGARDGARRHVLSVSGPVDHPEEVVQKVRARVAGALASDLDQRVATLSARASRPPTMEAYQEHVAGLEFFVRNEYRQAVPHFLRAAEVDTTFVLPRFWALFALGNSGQGERRDSLLQTLIPSRPRLSPLDRHSLDFFVASSRGDLSAALNSVEAAARLAPQSNWTYMTGNLNRFLYRPRAALAALDRLDPQRGWARGWSPYWGVRSFSHHILGQHEEELRENQLARRLDAHNTNLLEQEVRALAALGRTAEVRTRIDSAFAAPKAADGARRARPEDILLAAALELRGHGYRPESDELFDRLIKLYERAPESERAQPRHQWERARALYMSGRWKEAAPLLEALAADRSDDVELQAYLASVAARRGDGATARKIVGEIGAQSGPRNTAAVMYIQARVAALLGEREEAVRLVREAISRGYTQNNMIHYDIDMESLRAYVPFKQALRPQG